ncbi:PatA/PatG family cyanobactin maturation protease [Actinomadura sp. ATCC 31491]|uniref:PatA/PatG family cyanobactin maturation protease n=1 Tax=Actinomadura luzonensis TaxID=2805427 RepID=A0ABT0FTV5_9ACTN|nr:PatA/PatG family cyanobactin maturation protease [Actinomadura luzonensis]MCK2215762.1 PatA/PatG family cyanobactin maturation protease [Actinomadura luzonensis]
MGELRAVAGLPELWRRTTGDARVTVAVVDGAIDAGHPAFTRGLLRLAAGERGARIEAADHGTAVASVLAGRHDGPVPGVAPGCRVLGVTAFARGRRTTQLELARGIETALDAGAHVINISGGQLAAAEEAEDVLARAVRRCREQGVLVVAAAGNDGCLCDHVPAALDGVLAVGACDESGRPLPMSNHGTGSRRQGLLALGHDLLVAVPGGGTTRMSGTSFATPVVAGVAALLLSLQLADGGRPDPAAVGRALLDTAHPCVPSSSSSGGGEGCERHLNGTLDITKAVNAVLTHPTPATVPSASAEPPAESSAGPSAGVVASCDPGGPACSGAAPPGPAQQVTVSAAPGVRLAYALGALGYDFGTEARRDTFKQLMPPVEADGVPLPANPYDPRQMVDYLRDEPSEARALIWTLNLDLTPIYAVEPVGGYAPGVFKRLVKFLDRQLKAEDDVEFVDRVSVPGVLSGRTVRLFNGQHVPVVEVNLTRGLYGWSAAGLAHAVAGHCTPAAGQPGAAPGDHLTDAIKDFLQRIYYDLRNFGATSRDRALNYAATNAVQARETLAEALGRGMALQDIDVEKSPYGRPDSDCWDVKLRFFDPDNSRRAKRVYRFTIDVKDVLPVTVGQVRSWPEA